MAALVLVNAAALLRVFAAWGAPDEWYVAMVVAAGVTWIAAFALFAATYAPILTRPRPDGVAG